jgi:hypothetical protein
MAHWTERYLGRAYDDGGCWFLFRDVQRERFGRAIDMPGVVPTTLRAQVRAFEAGSTALRWAKVERPLEGDAVLMSESRHPHHIGTYVEMKDGPRVLHSLRGQGSACPSLAAIRLARFNVLGFYRPADECAAHGAASPAIAEPA